jgi:hypothetical protein
VSIYHVSTLPENNCQGMNEPALIICGLVMIATDQGSVEQIGKSDCKPRNGQSEVGQVTIMETKRSAGSHKRRRAQSLEMYIVILQNMK